jgi:hypothetical protein
VLDGLNLRLALDRQIQTELHYERRASMCADVSTSQIKKEARHGCSTQSQVTAVWRIVDLLPSSQASNGFSMYK